MKQRFALGSAAAVMVLAAGVIWIASAPRPAYAMDGVAESIRKARSYEYTMAMEVTMPASQVRRRHKVEMRSRFSWLAPGSYRMETKADSAMPGSDTLMIFPAGKPGIQIDRKAKKFTRQPARLGQMSPLMMVDKLSTFSGQADRLLGTKEIDGRTAKGFEIEARKIDPDVYSGPVEIWIDTQTNLPVLIRYKMTTSGVPATIRMSDFRWNVDLDPKLFDSSPPEGYAETVPTPSPLDEQIKKITASLKLYAKYGGGHYPRVKMVYGDVTRDEFVKLSGAPYPPRKEADLKDPRVKEVNDAAWALPRSTQSSARMPMPRTTARPSARKTRTRSSCAGSWRMALIRSSMATCGRRPSRPTGCEHSRGNRARPSRPESGSSSVRMLMAVDDPVRGQLDDLILGKDHWLGLRRGMHGEVALLCNEVGGCLNLLDDLFTEGAVRLLKPVPRALESGPDSSKKRHEAALFLKSTRLHQS